MGLLEAARAGLSGGRREPHNIYGSGNAGAQICSLLERIELSPQILRKVNCY